jgi:hypothetical protein
MSESAYARGSFDTFEPRSAGIPMRMPTGLFAVCVSALVQFVWQRTRE